MELTAWIDTLLVELPKLWQYLKTNRYPASFLANALGFSQETVDRLPQYLIWFMGFYFLCGALSLVLRFRKGQRSLNSLSHQINDVILVCCSTLFVPLLVFLAKACIYVLQNEVAPLRGEGDYVRFFGEAVSRIFYIILAFAGIAFTVWMPISSFLRYLKVYHLRGLPHGIFDVGLGLHVIATALLSAAYADRRLYLLLVPPVIALAVIQKGGYVPEEDNLKAPEPVPPAAPPDAVQKDGHIPEEESLKPPEPPAPPEAAKPAEEAAEQPLKPD